MVIQQQLIDSSGEIVKERFFNFLKGYHELHPNTSTSTSGSIGLALFSILSPHSCRLLVNYPEQITNMIKNDKSTVFVDYLHINQVN